MKLGMEVMKMTYNEIVNEFKENPRDVHTVPLDGRESKWFYVHSENGKVFISPAEAHTPSSNISSPRMLSEKEVVTMLDIYQRRKQGEHLSQEATDATRNQVYRYGIFHELKL